MLKLPEFKNEIYQRSVVSKLMGQATSSPVPTETFQNKQKPSVHTLSDSGKQPQVYSNQANPESRERQAQQSSVAFPPVQPQPSWTSSSLEGCKSNSQCGTLSQAPKGANCRVGLSWSVWGLLEGLVQGALLRFAKLKTHPVWECKRH